MCSLLIAGWWFCSEPTAQGVWSLMMDVGDGDPVIADVYPTRELCDGSKDFADHLMGEYGVVFSCEQMYGFKVQK